MGRLRTSGVTDPVSYDASEFTVSFRETTAYLGHVFDEYLHLGRRGRAALIDRYVSGLLIEHSIPARLQDASSSLLPRVRNRFFHEALKLRAKLKGHEALDLPHRLLTPDFSVEVIYDTPEFISSVDHKLLEQWDLELDEALALAKENMWMICNNKFECVTDGLHLSNAQDSHDASRLFMYDLVWQLKVRGQHVVLAPNRDCLIVTGAEEGESLVQAAELCTRILQEAPRPMDGRALVLDDRTWRPFMPPQSHKAYPHFRKLHLISVARDYNEQKELYDALHEQNGIDEFVASYSVAQVENTGELFSYAVWVDEVQCQLPVADKLVLMREKNGQPTSIGAIHWNRATAVMGDRLQPIPDSYPMRYRIGQGPSDSELAELEPDSTWS